MRIWDLLTESDTAWREDSKAALPNAQRWPGLDNSSPYPAYRFGVALAGAPNYKTNKKGPVGQNLMTLGYTDADREILRIAGEMMGEKGEDIGGDESKEMPDVNSASPVPQNSGKIIRRKRD